MAISYTPQGWTNNGPPGVSATHLLPMDNALKLAIDALNNMGDAGQLAVKEIGAAPATTTGGKLVNKITEAGYSLAPATGASNLDNIADGTSYKRVQAAKADAINNATILPLSGIQFPAAQINNSNPNTLDDYEEGTCTLVLMDSAGHSATMGSNNLARYTKIGDMVFVEGTVNWTNISSLVSDSRLRIAGLPFTACTTSHYRSPGNFGSSEIGTFTVTRQNISIILDYSNSFMWMTYTSGNNEDNLMTISHIGSLGTIFGVSIAYKV